MNSSPSMPANTSSEQSDESKNHGCFSELMWPFLLFTLVIISSAFFWNYTKQKQISELKQTAKSHMDIYGSKVNAALGSTPLNLISVLADHPAVQNFLATPSSIHQKRLQSYLNSITDKIPHQAVFIGNTRQQVLASITYQSDHQILKNIYSKISARLFKGKGTKLFLFPEDMIAPKFLMVVPLSVEHNIRGYIGVLLDLSFLQQKLSQSWVAKEQTLVVSDQRGIIVLSSDPNWLYRTFSDLPYNVKKKLAVNFTQQKRFNQLGLADLNEQVLTLNSIDIQTKNDRFLVQSMLLNDLPLRIHYLSNISSVEKNSATYSALVFTCLILLSLILLLFKEKKSSLLLEIAQQKQLREHEAEIKQHHKMAAMGVMATNLAHEISQPVTSIKTEASISKKHLQLGDVAKSDQSLSTIINYTNLLANIIAQLKNFARKNRIDIHAVANIYEVIQQSKILYQHRLDADHVYWQEAINDKSFQAKIDKYQLQQVLGNLIQNACDAMKNSSDKYLWVEVHAEDEYLYIDIMDSGAGINAEIQQSLFSPFVSSKNQSSSMGLGLAICKDILGQSNGNIELIKNNKITNFRVTLVRHYS